MKKLIYILLATSLIVSSCNDWLNVSPKTEMSVTDMFATEEGFKDATTACYIKMISENLYGGALSFGSIDYMAQYWDLERSNSDDIDKTTFADFKYEDARAKNVFNKIYAELYNVIVQANIVYENIKETKVVFRKENMKNIITGEVLAIRAFCHFDLLRLFGQMPSNPVKKVSLPYAEVVSPIENIPLYDYNSYIAKIEADLLDAEKLFDKDPVRIVPLAGLSNVDSYYSYRRFRINYFGLKALQARFYLYIGMKDKAYAAANEIIEAVDRDNKPIFELSGSTEFTAGHYVLPSEGLFNLSNNKLTVTESPIEFNTMSLEKIKNELFRGRSSVSNNRFKLLWGIRLGQNKVEYPLLLKYHQKKDASENVSNTTLLGYRQQVPCLRLSEVYLIAMETAPTLEETNSLYKTYMAARNEQVEGFATVEEANEEILNEYRREFIAEGQMFYTYKRKGTKFMMWKVDAEITEAQYIVPIPTTEFTK